MVRLIRRTREAIVWYESTTNGNGSCVSTLPNVYHVAGRPYGNARINRPCTLLDETLSTTRRVGAKYIKADGIAMKRNMIGRMNTNAVLMCMHGRLIRTRREALRDGPCAARKPAKASLSMSMPRDEWGAKSSMWLMHVERSIRTRRGAHGGKAPGQPTCDRLIRRKREA